MRIKMVLNAMIAALIAAFSLYAVPQKTSGYDIKGRQIYIDEKGRKYVEEEDQYGWTDRIYSFTPAGTVTTKPPVEKDREGREIEIDENGTKFVWGGQFNQEMIYNFTPAGTVTTKPPVEKDNEGRKIEIDENGTKFVWGGQFNQEMIYNFTPAGTVKAKPVTGGKKGPKKGRPALSAFEKWKLSLDPDLLKVMTKPQLRALFRKKSSKKK